MEQQREENKLILVTLELKLFFELLLNLLFRANLLTVGITFNFIDTKDTFLLKKKPKLLIFESILSSLIILTMLNL